MTGNSTTINERRTVIDWHPYYAVRIAGEWVLDWVRPDGVDTVLHVGGDLGLIEAVARRHKCVK